MSVYERFFVEGPEAASGRCEVLTGAIPLELRGSLIRNGGGRFRVGGDQLGFFDAHGLVAAVGFREGTAWWRASLVHTPVLREEAAAQRMTRRRVFANLPGGWWSNAFRMDAAHLANHDVYSWRGRLIAADGPAHFALDRALRTTGTFRMDPGASPTTMAAPMPQLDPATGHLIGYSLAAGGLRPDRLGFVEVGEDGTVRRTPWFSLGGSPVVIHGHAFSERWYAVVELPGRLALLPAILGRSTLSDAFRTPKGAVCTLILVPRGRPGAPVRIPLPGAAVIFHLVNMFDFGERIVVDAAVYAAEPALASVVPGGTAADAEAPVLARFIVDPATSTVERQDLGSSPCDAATVDPRFRGAPHQYLWGPVRAGEVGPVADFYGYFHGIARFELGEPEVAWSAGEGALVSQPAIVARPGSTREGEGWLLAWITRESGTSVVILDPLDLAAGPVAELALGVTLPGVSHSRFAPDFLVMTDEEAAASPLVIRPPTPPRGPLASLTD